MSIAVTITGVMLMDDDSFRRLLTRLGLSWRGYAKVRKGVKKRIQRRMSELGLLSMDEYLQAMADPDVLKDVERLMGVSISRFFRDRNLWRTLTEEILPVIIAGHGEEIDVWSAGCGLGQEAYSLAVEWEMLKEKRSALPELRVLATDINPDYLEKARSGVYSRCSLKGMPDGIRSIYFRTCEDAANYCAADSLKKYITWKVHDLMRERPPARLFQIIFLRNSLFTYYRSEDVSPVFLNIMDSIDDAGFFIIGNRERLPLQTSALSSFKGSSYIFQKK